MPIRHLQPALRLLTLLAALCTLPATAAEPALHFGVFPRWNAQTMVRDFTPLARALEQQLGRFTPFRRLQSSRILWRPNTAEAAAASSR